MVLVVGSEVGVGSSAFYRSDRCDDGDGNAKRKRRRRKRGETATVAAAKSSARSSLLAVAAFLLSVFAVFSSSAEAFSSSPLPSSPPPSPSRDVLLSAAAVIIAPVRRLRLSLSLSSSPSSSSSIRFDDNDIDSYDEDKSASSSGERQRRRRRRQRPRTSSRAEEEEERRNREFDFVEQRREQQQQQQRRSSGFVDGDDERGDERGDKRGGDSGDNRASAPHGTTATAEKKKKNKSGAYWKLYEREYDDDGEYDDDEYRMDEQQQQQEEDDGYYGDGDGNNNYPEWERCSSRAGTAHVLLPPPSVERPSCVVHFVGGTFFGSAPDVWYRQLLEDLVRHTQAVVVASGVPASITESPLQHVRLARQVKRQFDTAYERILQDEYDPDVLRKLPHCGIGHSLGARLFVVGATLADEGGGSTKRRGRSSAPPPFKSLILISFTNYAAAAGIPGLAQLHRASRRVELDNGRRRRGEEDEARGSGFADFYDNENGLDGNRKRRNSRSRSNGSDRRRKRRRRDDWFDDDERDDDDEYDIDLLEELQHALETQTTKLRNALTPTSEQLEFYPTPDQLWKALIEDGRYNVPQTLVVQLDDDDVDQSSKLAAALSGSSDVRFARLRGTHLTPVSTSAAADGAAARQQGGDWFNRINSQTGRLLGKLLKSGRRGTGNVGGGSGSGDNSNSNSNDVQFRDLRQTIARYATEIVTKD